MEGFIESAKPPAGIGATLAFQGQIKPYKLLIIIE
jgi:hypothetical protein